jgi:hypothetical protein
MCYFDTVQCGLESIELKAKAGALVFNIEIKVGAKAGHLGHDSASSGLSTPRRRHSHGGL